MATSRRNVRLDAATLARSLLSPAIDAADSDPANIVALLDGIDGAWADAQEGWRQARAGDTVPLDELKRA